MTDLITLPRATVQQALEALKQSETWVPDEGFGMLRREAERKHEAAITNLKAALEQPEQEPVANNPDPHHLSRILHELAGSASMCWEHVDRAGVFQSTQAADFVAAAIAEIRQRMKDTPPRRETEQEPVAWVENDGEIVWCDKARATGRNLYTHPPRREWRSLSEEEIYPLYSEPSSDAEMVEFARAIEAALKEINT